MAVYQKSTNIQGNKGWISNKKLEKLLTSYTNAASGLRHCEWIRGFPVQTALDACPGYGTQPHYEVLSHLLDQELTKMQWLASGEAGHSKIAQSWP